MIFRYWKSDGKVLIISKVDRVLFDSLDKLRVRSFENSVFKWYTFSYCDDYKQFTLTQE